MFGFGKKKEPPVQNQKANQRTRRSEEFNERKAQSKAQLGFLVGLDNDEGGTAGLSGLGGGSFDVDDAELENELLMLLGDNPSPSKPKPGPPSISGQRSRPRAPVAAGLDNIDFNINLEDEGQNEDDDDLDDPDLHAELGEILGDPESSSRLRVVERNLSPEPEENIKTPSITGKELVNLLQERLQLYEQAKTAADKVGDSGKSRRFTRGVKTLKELLVKAKAGRVVDEADIPPIVSLGVAAAPIQKEVEVEMQPEDSQLNNVPIPIPPTRNPKKNLVPDPAPVTSDSSRDFLAPSPQPSLPEPLQPLKPTPSPRQINPKPPPEPQPDYEPKEPPIDYDTAELRVLRDPPNPVVDARLKDYKKMAVVLKRNGDVQGALQYLKISKALEVAINSGQEVDLNLFPDIANSSETSTEINPPAGSQFIPIPVEQNQQQTHPDENTGAGSGDPNSADDIFGAPPPPRTVLEALEQRLDKYKSEVEKANGASNSSKARRMGRIVKQYEEAIGFYKKGKPVPYEDLPTPPGFAPIPIPMQGNVTIPPAPENANIVIVRPAPQIPVTNPEDTFPSPEKKVKPGPSPGSSPAAPSSSPAGVSSINRGAVGGRQMTKLTLQEKQLAEVLLRQKQYRDAAVEAKKRGDVNQAREYLRVSKGFENLIEASKSGLPVDLKTLPAPPESVALLEAEDFEVVSDQDCIVPSGGNLAEVYEKLEEDLKQQLKMCMRTREHFKNIGDIGSSNRFESMALDTKKDLDALRLAAKSCQAAPRYHYENRIFSITECNTDIKEDEMEITVMRGINFKGNSGLDTYVRVELAYPSPEEAQSQKSQVVKDSTDPEYNVTYKMNISKSARNFHRFVHRHGVKVEIWSKGGFLRSSSLFGVATAKLQPLENKTMLHDAFDVLDGRKVVGKLEIKIRLRDPVLTKQITQKKEKWLSIDRA